MKLGQLLIFCFVLLCTTNVFSQSEKSELALPDSVHRVYNKLMKRWDRKLDFREDQKKIFWELLSIRYNKIKQLEDSLYPDKKMIYKDARPVNARFYDNVKDMMTVKQWILWEKYMEKYKLKKLKKNNNMDLSYFEFWKY